VKEEGGRDHRNNNKQSDGDNKVVPSKVSSLLDKISKMLLHAFAVVPEALKYFTSKAKKARNDIIISIRFVHFQPFFDQPTTRTKRP
jgi:hypothetical protein